jgi:hypothetical protein
MRVPTAAIETRQSHSDFLFLCRGCIRRWRLPPPPLRGPPPTNASRWGRK